MKEDGIFSKEHRYIVEKIKRGRIEKGFTQAELAECLGKTQSYISKIESGQSRIDVLQIRKIAKALGTNVGHFLD